MDLDKAILDGMDELERRRAMNRRIRSMFREQGMHVHTLSWDDTDRITGTARCRVQVVVLDLPEHWCIDITIRPGELVKR